MPTPTKPTRIWVSGEKRPPVVIDRLPTTFEQERGTKPTRLQDALLVIAAVITAVAVWALLVLVIVMFGTQP